MLMTVSTLLFLTDPRRNHPFAAPEDRTPLHREELFGSFIDVPAPETSALLAMAAEMADDDDVLRARIRRELAARPRTGPAWIAGLPKAGTYRAVQMSHILGDGDNIILGTRLSGGHEFTCSVYIDHNLGTIVKDAIVVPEPIATVVAKYQEVADDPDTRWDDITLADAKVRINGAIRLAAMMVPPFETDEWPASRALVEWTTRRLPDGGAEYERQKWDSDEEPALGTVSSKSALGARLDDHDHRGLLESLLWYGTDYANGDPMRWSTVKVELLLMDWLPRKIVAPAEYLAKAPDLLRAFVRFAHAEVGVRAGLTLETLTAIDEWEPEYQKIIRSSRPQGAHALLASLGLDDQDDEFDDDLDDEDFSELVLDGLAFDVGGRDALDRLDDRPLPDEPFSWRRIAEDVESRVREVLALIDRCCDDLLDVEYRTACRRLLSRVAAGDAELFRRKGKAETAAAAIVWLIGKVNHVFGGQYGHGMQVNELMSYFGLKGGVSQRAETLLRAGGFECRTYDLHLGPEYLTSARRRRVIQVRDRHRPLTAD